MTGRELLDRDPMLVQRIQAGLAEENHHVTAECVDAWRERRQTLDRPLKDAVDVELVLTLTADDDVGRIDKVEVPIWPTELDDGFRTCLSDGLTGATFDARDIALVGTVAYPLLIQP